MERTRGIAEAVSAVRRGELIVLPTDTVYGVGADAFTPPAVNALLEAKGRGREMPPPVLVGSVRAAAALVDDLGTYGQDLIDEFWPGALTLVCRANPNLIWDLGETKGTVAVRMPMHELAVEVLKETGPLAVSSANLTGRAAARDAGEAAEMLGESVSVYLDGGASGHADPSTILDLTGPVPRLLRAGAIPEDKIRSIVGVLLTDEDEPDKPDELDASAEAASDAESTKPSLTKGETAEARDVPAEPASDAQPAQPSLTKGEVTEVRDAPAEAPADTESTKPSLTKGEAAEAPDEPAEPAADAAEPAAKPSLAKNEPTTDREP
ncbi:L-threonylcarbamoyladenylate synthase [Actinomadura chokoriensis]|uniref:L-threonylcarbamoyladenylate synthase n=1 Tax=Actinomadura chokoriensis TaxID=454156 RepID=A0ABV4R7K6_9ACTN